MFNKCKVVLLPSDEKVKDGDLCLNSSYLPNLTQPLVQVWLEEFPEGENSHLKPQRLYILSDEEIKEGDWFINRQYFIERGEKEYDLWQHNGEVKPNSEPLKVIATTNVLYNTNSKTSVHTLIPSIPQSFIDKYVSEYNKGNKIEDVMVEYENIINQETQLGNYDNLPLIKEVIKLNSGNTINIKSIKDSWTRDEVIDIIRTFRNDILVEVSKGSVNNFTEKWIKSNL